MLLELLKRSDIGDVLKLCSPSLFKVLSVGDMTRAIRALMGSRSEKTHAPLLARHGPLHAGDAGMVFESKAGSTLAAKPSNAKALGDTVLRIYFRELLGPPDTLLDLRPSAFHAEGDVLGWAPAPGSVTWDPAFITPLRGMYRGFYGGDDALFRASLAELHLEASESLFREYFGDGDQRAVTFSTRSFTRIFGAVFETCAKAGVELHANFLPLGFFLAALYQTLEQLGGAYDVRAAFDSASGSYASKA